VESADVVEYRITLGASTAKAERANAEGFFLHTKSGMCGKTVSTGDFIGGINRLVTFTHGNAVYVYSTATIQTSGGKFFYSASPCGLVFPNVYIP